jgi:hypothetical protein
VVEGIDRGGRMAMERMGGGLGGGKRALRIVRGRGRGGHGTVLVVLRCGAVGWCRVHCGQAGDNSDSLTTGGGW